MAEYKQIQTRIWQDNWFLSLNSEEKLLWIFLLTNEYSHISGFYELPKPLLSPLTGIKDYEKILNKFVIDGKIKTYQNWVYILNKRKHQPISNSIKDNVNISIEKYLEQNKAIFTQISKPLESPLKAPLATLLEIESQSQIEIQIQSQIEKEAEKSATPSQNAKLFFINLDEQEDYLKYFIEYGIEESVARREIDKFINYWTEPNKSGTRQRWELEKTFEIRRRLKNWFSKIKTFQGFNKIAVTDLGQQ